MRIIKFQKPAGPLRPSETPSWQAEWVTEKKEKDKKEEQEYQKEMSQPYYSVHKKPTKDQWRKSKQKQSVVYPTDKVIAPIKAINNYVGQAKYELANNKVPSGKYIYPAAILGGLTLGGIWQAPVTAAAAMAGGYVGNEAVNKGSEIITGKNWGENISELTGLAPEAAYLTNPGMWLGANHGAYLIGKARAAAYNNISPMGYKDTELSNGIKLNKKTEIFNTLKDWASPRKIKPNLENPKWMRNIKSQPAYRSNQVMWRPHNVDENGVENIITMKDFLDFRNEAWKMAMRQISPKDSKLYVPNGDGTYSYNMAYVNPRLHRWDQNIEKYVGTGFNGEVGHSKFDGKPVLLDAITGNGGGVGVKTINGKQYMIDRWDLHPLADGFRSLAPWLTKNIPITRKWEAIKTLDGNRFNLKQEL